MTIGTSDGSDFGGAGHDIDGPTQSHFCRFDLYHPERNVQIAVFLRTAKWRLAATN